MAWKDQLNKAIEAVKEASESETVRNFTATAKETATMLAQKAKAGTLDAAEALVEANADPSAVTVQFQNARFSVISPGDGLEISRPTAATVVISDGQGNGLVINAAADKAYVSETIGEATQLGVGTYDLGAEDGENVVVVKT
jgi:hypothetical protein